MTKDEEILQGLDLLGDWLDAKGYGEEAGLVLRALSLIHKLQDGVRSTIQERDVLSGENFDLRAENEKLRAVIQFILDNTISTHRSEGVDAVLIHGEPIRAAAAALKETGDD